MAQDLLILSPEKTILSYRLATVGSRLLAHLLDLLLFGAIAWGASTLTMFTVGLASPGLAQSIIMFILFLGYFVYFLLFEGLWNGQTIGKKALGLRVRMADGTALTFAGALGRNLTRVADILPIGYFFGLIAMFTNPRSQRIGDLVAGTVVLHEKRALPIFTPTPYSLGVHPLEEFVGELRGMNNDEYVALKRFCDRFPELPNVVQERLVRDVYAPIAAARGVKPLPNVHPLYLAEAMVMKYGRTHGLM